MSWSIKKPKTESLKAKQKHFHMTKSLKYGHFVVFSGKRFLY